MVLKIERWERAAVDELREKIQLGVEIVGLSGRIVETTLGAHLDAHGGKLSLSQRVSAHLLSRLLKDLRCMQLVGERGYPAQACVVASSLLESAFTLGYVGNDEARAESWHRHSSPTRSWRSVRTTIKDVFEKRISRASLRAEKIDEWQNKYAQLCMLKHANPLAERSLGLKSNKALNGPDYSERAVRVVLICFGFGGVAAANGAGFVLSAHLSTAATKEVEADVASLLAKNRELGQRAHASGWTIDPLPGKW
jgi:hypothetical protein